MTIIGDVRRDINSFKYLELFIQKNCGFNENMKHRIKCGLIEWRDELGILCDERILMRLKVKLYKMRPTIVYGLEYWAVNRNIEQKVNIMERTTLR